MITGRGILNSTSRPHTHAPQYQFVSAVQFCTIIGNFWQQTILNKTAEKLIKI